MQPVQVVVHDPLGETPEGLIAEGNQARVLKSRGVILMPTHADLMVRSGVGGYIKRSFGKGVAFDIGNRRGCKTALYVHPGYRYIKWNARIIPEPRADVPSGEIRLSADTTQQNHMASGLSSSRTAAKLDGPPDKYGGWTVGGECEYTPVMAGLLGLCLYGTLDQARVMWLAVSQS